MAYEQGDASLGVQLFGGERAADATIKAAQNAVNLNSFFFNKSQENLAPFSEFGTNLLPGLEDSASMEGFFGDAAELGPIVQGLNAGAIQEQTRDINSQLGARGLTRSGAGVEAVAGVSQALNLERLLSLSGQLQGRRERLAGLGTGTSQALAGLGQASAESSANLLGQGILGAAQARAQGQQGLLNIGGAAASSFAGRQSSGGNQPGTAATTSGGTPITMFGQQTFNA